MNEEKSRNTNATPVDTQKSEHTEEAIDQTLVKVNTGSYNDYWSIIDRLPSGEGFERLMNAPAPWTKGRIMSHQDLRAEMMAVARGEKPAPANAEQATVEPAGVREKS